ncbi:MAG TPA: hypothetical protein PLN26_04250 [Acidobacteriota bacterium]|nr:hypothetical protein [Acidobacteriota bacterium]HQF86419.1 hypothetical protein [Acidobacteriota bacterium]HQG90338.1 hypothetical protein [Acidobacteriota bacterium]HQK87995.1 hypothetical protein [Acidobacteriota bacterium]HQM64494.1 hypothetical protein [Acidobacteriota bacterium]
MNDPFGAFAPATPPDAMLAAVHREAGRRRRRRRSVLAGLACLAVAAVALWWFRPAPAPPSTGGAVLVHAVTHGDQEVPYTLLTLPDGMTMVVVRTAP